MGKTTLGMSAVFVVLFVLASRAGYTRTAEPWNDAPKTAAERISKLEARIAANDAEIQQLLNRIAELEAGQRSGRK